MRRLYHFWLSPFSRKVRIFLAEKRLEFEMVVEDAWERRREFLVLNPAGTVPVLIEPDGVVLAESSAICAYLNDIVPEPDLMGDTPLARAETLRLAAWFDLKFHHEVTRNLLDEKIMKRLRHEGEPDSRALRAGRHNIHYHLDYIGYLSERRRWLSGDSFSLADIAAAAQLSCIDYANDVPWDAHEPAKLWYSRVKSRPSFRPLLADRVGGVVPARHYANLDF